MTKFVCTESKTKDVPVGTTLVGMWVSDTRFITTEDSKITTKSTGIPWFREGMDLPLVGELWHWEPVQEDVTSRTESPQKALERFEEAVRSQEEYHYDINKYGDSELDFTKVQAEYKETKAELLVWLSYIP